MISGSALKLFWGALGVFWVYRVAAVRSACFAYSSSGFAVFIRNRHRLRAFFQKCHFCDVNKQVSAEQRKIRLRIEETSHRRSVSRFECSGKMLFRADSSSGFAVFIENRTSPRTFCHNSFFFEVNTSISVILRCIVKTSHRCILPPSECLGKVCFSQTARAVLAFALKIASVLEVFLRIRIFTR